MSRDFKVQKRLILSTLCVVLLGDLVLGVVSWRFNRELASPQMVLAQARLREKTLDAAVQRALKIRKSYPEVAKQCDDFEKALRPVSEEYSSILTDLGVLAKKAGLETEGKTFRETDLKERGLAEVSVEMTVAGNYASIVQFINELQRTENFYVLEELSLASEAKTSGNGLKLTLHLKTYFRS